MKIIERIFHDVKDIPTLPTVYSTLCDAIDGGRSSAQDIAKIISGDQATAMRILRIANSPFYGFSGSIDTISRAAMILGFDEVKNLVLSSSVMNLFTKRKSLMGFRPSHFWAHSIGVGLITRRMGQTLGMSHPENLFLAGILHDIGKLVLFEYAQEDFAQVLTLVEKKRTSIREAELEILGMDHALVGGLLAAHWQLPDPIRNAIHSHHFGMIGEKTDPLVAAVHLGNILARALELGFSGDDLLPQPNEVIWNVLKWKPGMIPKIALSVLNDFEKTTSTMMIQ